MGLIDSLFVSKEERERRAREFDIRVFPLGLEGQRAAVCKLLSTQLDKGRGRDSELLFAYLTAKDKYILSGKEEKGLKAASFQLKNLGWLSKEQKRFILALVLMDSQIQSLDEYPSEHDILEYMEREPELLAGI